MKLNKEKTNYFHGEGKKEENTANNTRDSINQGHPLPDLPHTPGQLLALFYWNQ